MHPSACWIDDQMVGRQPPRVADARQHPPGDRRGARPSRPPSPRHRHRAADARPRPHRAAEGRTTVLTEVSMPFARPAGLGRDRMFAEKHGFAIASLEIHRVLDLPVPVGSPRRSSQAEIGDRADGYRAGDLRGPGARRARRGVLRPADRLQLRGADGGHGPRARGVGRGAGAKLRGAVRAAGSPPAAHGRDRARRHDGSADRDDVDRRADRSRLARRHAGAAGSTAVTASGMATKIANLRAFMADFPSVRQGALVERRGERADGGDQRCAGFRPVEYVAEMQLKL